MEILLPLTQTPESTRNCCIRSWVILTAAASRMLVGKDVPGSEWWSFKQVDLDARIVAVSLCHSFLVLHRFSSISCIMYS